MLLSREEGNYLYESIQESQLDLAECSLERGDDMGVIKHRSGSSFEIYRDSHGEEFSFRYVILDSGKVFKNFRYGSLPLDYVKHYIIDWANKVKELEDLPDLWAQMERNRELITEIQQTDSDNTPFTQDEQRQISAQLQDIKELIRGQFELTTEQVSQVDEKIDDVIEASKRMGRKDWLIYFLGTITSLIITATVTGGIGEQIIAMVIYALGNLFTGGNAPPQILP